MSACGTLPANRLRDPLAAAGYPGVDGLGPRLSGQLTQLVAKHGALQVSRQELRRELVNAAATPSRLFREAGMQPLRDAEHQIAAELLDRLPLIPGLGQIDAFSQQLWNEILLQRVQVRECLFRGGSFRNERSDAQLGD